MPRYVSNIRRFGVGIVEPRVHISNYGDRIIDREGYSAQFMQNDLTDRDVEVATATFEMNGMTTLIDEVTPTPIIDRLSTFDTDDVAIREEWTPDFKAMVEEKLARLAARDPHFCLVEQIRQAPPWPLYMQFSGTLEQLLDILVQQGHNLREVIRFEEETGHRQAVINALNAKLDELDAETADVPEIMA